MSTCNTDTNVVTTFQPLTHPGMGSRHAAKGEMRQEDTIRVTLSMEPWEMVPS